MKTNMWISPKRPRGPQEANIAIVQQIMNDYTEYSFMFPNKEKAPWHVIAVNGQSGVQVHIYPHLLKGHFDEEKSVQGGKAIRKLLDQGAVLDDYDPLIEDFDETSYR